MREHEKIIDRQMTVRLFYENAAFVIEKERYPQWPSDPTYPRP